MQTQLAHLIIAHVAPLPRDQSRISADVRKSLIYAPSDLRTYVTVQWVKWIGYNNNEILQLLTSLMRITL